MPKISHSVSMLTQKKGEISIFFIHIMETTFPVRIDLFKNGISVLIAHALNQPRVQMKFSLLHL